MLELRREPVLDTEKAYPPPNRLDLPPKQELEVPRVAAGLTLLPVEGSPLLLLSFTVPPAHASDPLCFPFRTKSWLTFLAALLVMCVSRGLVAC